MPDPAVAARRALIVATLKAASDSKSMTASERAGLHALIDAVAGEVFDFLDAVQRAAGPA